MIATVRFLLFGLLVVLCLVTVFLLTGLCLWAIVYWLRHFGVLQ